MAVPYYSYGGVSVTPTYTTYINATNTYSYGGNYTSNSVLAPTTYEVPAKRATELDWLEAEVGKVCALAR